MTPLEGESVDGCDKVHTPHPHAPAAAAAPRTHGAGHGAARGSDVSVYTARITSEWCERGVHRCAPHGRRARARVAVSHMIAGWLYCIRRAATAL